MAKLYTVLKADNKQLRNLIIKELKETGYEPVLLDGEHIYAEGNSKELYASAYTLENPPKYVVNKGGQLSARRTFGRRAGAYALLEIARGKAHPSVLFYNDRLPSVACEIVKDYSYAGLTADGTINTATLNGSINKERNNE